MNKAQKLGLTIGGALVTAPSLVLLWRYAIPAYVGCWHADAFWTAVITMIAIGVVAMVFSIPYPPSYYSRPVKRPTGALPPDGSSIRPKP